MHAEIMIIQQERACGKDAVLLVCVKSRFSSSQAPLNDEALSLFISQRCHLRFCTSPYWSRNWLPIRRKRDRRRKYWFFP